MAITLRRLFRNYISLIGGILAGLSFIVNVFLLFLDFLSPTQNPYVGIITYMILPGVTLTGPGSGRSRRTARLAEWRLCGVCTRRVSSPARLAR